MTDSKYFTTNKKGEIFELKAELNNEKKEKRKEAVKKVIAAMTVGKDVSSLFPDVVNCMQTDNLELKKLVYLYLMNYAKSQPDMAIMAVNSFVKDCEDPNPLIRALAVRTMGCIRVDKITEYLCEPLRKCLKDEDPYVRKTAAVCVAKLHDINAQMVEDQGFLDSLRDLIADSNPMIFIEQGIGIRYQIVGPTALLILPSVFLTDSVAELFSDTVQFIAREVLRDICERVTPRLSHANSAVVLSAVKVLMKFLELLPKDSDYYNMLLKKLAPPLVTLLSGEPEVQYVALRNINLIVQKRPEILKQEIKVFFVKYNDPIYVKLEKLDIMIRLASQANIAQVVANAVAALSEISESHPNSNLLDLNPQNINKLLTALNECTEWGQIFILDCLSNYNPKDDREAQRSVSSPRKYLVQLTLLTAIVKLFLKKPSETQELVQQVLSLATQQSAERCVSTLLDLIQTKVNYVVQEAIVVIRDIFRKYPNKYVQILLPLFLRSFRKCLSKDSDNPDLRDRGYIYWRLLSTDPVTAKEVVLSEKPLISEETDLIEPTLLDELICHIGSLASVYHKPPNAFVEGSHGIHRKHLPIHHGSTDAGDSPVGTTTATNLEQPQVIPSQGDLLGDLLNLDLGPPVNVPQVSSMQMGAVDLLGGGLDSLLGSDLGGGIGGSPAVGQSFIPSSVPATFAPSPTPAVVSSGLNDLFELSTGIGMAPGGYVAPKAVWLPAVKAKGLEISGTFTHRQGHIYMEMNFTNKALQHMTDFAIQFNKNSFGVIPSTPLAIHTPLMPNQSIDVSLPLNTLGPVMKMEPLNNLQVAVKNNIDVFYFSCLIPLNVLFVEDGKMDTVSSKLQNNNVYTIAKRNVEGQDMLYQSLKLTNGIWILAELRIQPGNPNYTLSLKCRAPEVSQYIYQVYDSILKN
ncbi:PREDICTED: AP-2 complex subunit beta [Propithecus coquereli]|uniref:AP-2 complex subunit beta n=1 Tax=Propithecus coquereli TaxID=379532 RepID=UPI00063F6A1D|nr:PREDICTED: AP-2 complex subunit beta [Propithecus coquereli]